MLADANIIVEVASGLLKEQTVVEAFPELKVNNAPNSPVIIPFFISIPHFTNYGATIK